MKVILYTTDCPKCKILEKKLREKNIDYEIVNDRKEMIKLNMLSAPNLKVNDNLMNFTKAIEWINDYKGEIKC